MKKIISLIITLAYFGVNSCFAFSELYYLKNTTTDKIKPMVSNVLAQRSFATIKQEPFYAQSRLDPSEYAVIILQQSGANVFYYYNSNENKRVNNDILKAVKRSGIEYEESINSNVLSIYDNIAQRTMSTSDIGYTFEEPEQAIHLKKYPADAPDEVQTRQTQAQPQTPSTLKGAVVQLDSGTKIKVYLQTPINTASSQKGDSVVAVLTQDIKYRGYTVLPQGSIVQGSLSKARHAQYGSRNGRVVIEFHTIVTPDNQSYSISTEKIDFTVSNEGKFQRTATSVAAGAAVGALLGLLFGAMGDGNMATSAAIGAGMGAGTALVGGVAERGVDAEIPSFTEMELTLNRSLRVALNY